MKNKVFLVIFLSLFIFFSVLLIAESQGYYKGKNEKAKTLTEKQIKEFEHDVALGKDIDIKKYVLYEERDYSNNVTKDVYDATLKLENIFDFTIKLVFNGLSKTINE